VVINLVKYYIQAEIYIRLLYNKWLLYCFPAEIMVVSFPSEDYLCEGKTGTAADAMLAGRQVRAAVLHPLCNGVPLVSLVDIVIAAERFVHV